MAEKIWRGGMGLRPAPGPRRYWQPSGRVTTGTSGSTLAQNASETVQHLICGILELIFARFAPLYALFFAIENQVQHYLRISSKCWPHLRCSKAASTANRATEIVMFPN